MQYSAQTLTTGLKGRIWNGQVDSVFDRVCNLNIDQEPSCPAQGGSAGPKSPDCHGGLIILSDAGLPMTPQSIAINGFWPSRNPGIRRGLSVCCDGQTIRLGTQVSIRLSDAANWPARLEELPCAHPSGNRTRQWRALASVVKELSAEVTAKLAWHPWLSAEGAGSRKTSALICQLAGQRAPHSDCAHLFQRLLGAGPGLTPSGDDFILGYLAACFGLAGAEAAPVLAMTGQQLIPLLPRLTTRVSAHYLSCAFAGEFSEDVIDLISAFDTAATLQHIDRAARRLCQCGHSSGLDCAFGILAGSLEICAVPIDELKQLLPVVIDNKEVL